MTVRLYEGCWGVTLVREFGEDASRLADAMSRREPDGISTEAWDQLVADMAKELGVGNG